MKVKDIAWLAGLIEGEGSFLLHNGSPSIQVQMTDQDVLQCVADMFETRLSPPYYPKGKETYKAVYKCSVHGTRAVGWMLTLFTYLGKRRRAKVTEIMTAWKAAPAFPRASRGTHGEATCHQGLRRIGNGLCKNCYMKQWRLDRKTSIKSLG